METITLMELLTVSGVSIGAILGAWIHMKVSVASLKSEMEHVKEELKDEKLGNKENYINLNSKIDKLFSLMTEIKVSVAKK